ncbi:MAG: type II toxin-antitoxin system VapB family antitoxin [Opitutaceae bacterium]|nr:type II toxin-antitoxin system VapB family antitoxin [Opitutaceae bacterium]
MATPWVQRQIERQPSKRATVEEALREYVQRRRQTGVLRSFGKIDYEENYDYKAARRGRHK